MGDEAEYLMSQGLGELADKEWRDQEHELNRQEMKRRYNIAKAAKTNTEIQCACCGRRIMKFSYQQAFCKKKGKGSSWNYIKKNRRNRFSRK